MIAGRLILFWNNKYFRQNCKQYQNTFYVQ